MIAKLMGGRKKLSVTEFVYFDICEWNILLTRDENEYFIT